MANLRRIALSDTSQEGVSREGVRIRPITLMHADMANSTRCVDFNPPSVYVQLASLVLGRFTPHSTQQRQARYQLRDVGTLDLFDDTFTSYIRV